MKRQLSTTAVITIVLIAALTIGAFGWIMVNRRPVIHEDQLSAGGSKSMEPAVVPGIGGAEGSRGAKVGVRKAPQ